jgi:hypothetical protein
MPSQSEAAEQSGEHGVALRGGTRMAPRFRLGTTKHDRNIAYEYFLATHEEISNDVCFLVFSFLVFVCVFF